MGFDLISFTLQISIIYSNLIMMQVFQMICVLPLILWSSLYFNASNFTRFFSSHIYKERSQHATIIKAFEESFGRVNTNLNKYNHPGPCHFAYIMRLSQIRCFILDVYHCSWLNTLSLHSTQIVQGGVMPLERCHILIFSTNFFKISSPKRACFQGKNIILAYPNPTKFMHDEGGPLARPSSLDAIPKLMFNQFTSVGKTNKT